MDSRKTKSSRYLAPLYEIGAVLREALTSPHSFDACCGITLERARPASDLPTPSSCCGVRL